MVMRQTSQQYIQEEARLRGSRSRVKAVISPFDLDLGLAPSLGVFENTVFGGESGKIVLLAGYFDQAAWISPVRQTFSPYLNRLAGYWEDHVSYMECRVYLRSAASEAELGLRPL